MKVRIHAFFLEENLVVTELHSNFALPKFSHSDGIGRLVR